MPQKMTFGKKAKSLKSMKKNLQSRKERGGGIQWIGENGLNVRFLQEPEEWLGYREAFSPSMKKSWPLPEDTEPQAEDAKVSFRHAAVALDIDNNKVIAVKLPITLVDLLTGRAEKRGTLLDVDMELYRTGEGINTVYGFDIIDKVDRDLDQYEDDFPDVGKLLAKDYFAVWGEDDDEEEDDEDEAPARRAKATASKRRSAKFDEDEDEEDDDDEDLDDDDEEVDDDDDDDDDDLDDDEDEDEPDDEDEDDAEEDGEAWTREELEDLTLAELRSIASENDIASKGLKKSQLVDAIMGDDAF